MVAIALENATSNLQRASRLATQRLADTLLEHVGMGKMDKRVVDRWQPKHATELPAHVLTILDKLDTERDNKIVQCPVMAPRVALVVCKGQGALRHCPCLQFWAVLTQQRFGCAFHKLGVMYTTVVYIEKGLCAL